LIFGMQMNITDITCFSVCVRDRGGKFMSPVLSQQMLAYYVLRWTKYLLKYANCDVLARVRIIILNKFMGTTG
jgi:hypothetical protein